MALLLCAIFLFSGASALVFEALWFRQAGLALGNSVWASGLVLAGFMGGLGFGNALAARFGHRLGNPIRAYAAMELAIALTGVGLVYVLPFLAPALAPWLRGLEEQRWLLHLVRLGVALAFLLIPSTAMGLTLPLLTRALMASEANFGRVLGRLYGWNTAGAVIGAVLVETHLIGAFGIRGSALAAGTINGFAATIAVGLAARMPEPTPVARSQAWNWRVGRAWLLATFLSGFALLALEVVWLRFLSLFVLSHSESFALMLAVVLAGIALGGFAASWWLRAAPSAHRFAVPVAFAAGTLCVLSYAGIPWFLEPLGGRKIAKASLILPIASPLMLPVSFSSGVLFTLIGARLRSAFPTEIATTGALTFANTVGAALGALAGGFALLPLLGMERSLFALALLYGAIGLLLLVRTEAPRALSAAVATAFAASAVLFPFGAMGKEHIRRALATHTDPARSQVFVREGLSETILLIEERILGNPHYYRMVTNAFSMSGTAIQGRRYMKLFVYLPMALHPPLERVLLISYGVGCTAKALTDSRTVESIDIVDISREIVEMSDVIYSSNGDHPLRDPRVRMHIEDGRFFLQATDQSFDLITGEPPPPENAGVVNLYTREYFQLVYDRLAEGGFATYWLPLHTDTDVDAKAIIRAFCDVFADCSLWKGMLDNLMLMGTRNAQGGISAESFVRQWSDPGVAEELETLGLEVPEQLGALFVGDADYLNDLTRGVSPLVDDRPKRISTPASAGEKQRWLSGSLVDAAAARERFSQSPLIHRLWPESLRTATLPYFEFQHLIDTLEQRIQPNRWEERFASAHEVLTRHAVSAPVLWLLGSDGDIQRIVARAGPELSAQPEAQLHRGIGHLSEREYGAALESLARAATHRDTFHRAVALQIFSLCLLGRIDEAQLLARERYAELGSGGRMAGYWSWMKSTFGIDPTGTPPQASARVEPSGKGDAAE